MPKLIKDYPANIIIRIPEELKAKLIRHCKSHKTTASLLIRRYISSLVISPEKPLKKEAVNTAVFNTAKKESPAETIAPAPAPARNKGISKKTVELKSQGLKNKEIADELNRIYSTNKYNARAVIDTIKKYKQRKKIE